MTRQIVWDWNGTLLDDLRYAMDVRNRSFPAFSLPTIDSVEDYHRQFTFPVRTYYERAGVTEENFEAVAHAWMAEYVRGFSCVKLHADARETLERFHKAGLRQVMLSATRRDMLAKQVTPFGILPYFSELLGLSDIYAGSKEAIGRAYLEGCGIPADETVLIGDTLHDADVARSLGARCVLVSRGHQSAETLRASGFPVVNSLREAADRLLDTP